MKTGNMRGQQPVIVSAPPRRRPFVASAVAVQAIIVNEQEQLLLLSSPRRHRQGEWQTVSGALEAGETLLDGTLREALEEAGPELQLRPLGVVHAHTFHYDDHVQYMIDIFYLLAYEGGAVRPGDDMDDAWFRWWSLEELISSGVRFHVSTRLWILQRGVELYRLWKDQEVPLQPCLDER